MEKATLGFRVYKIWQILKRFAGTFCRAQTLKLGGVILYLQKRNHKKLHDFLLFKITAGFNIVPLKK